MPGIVDPSSAHTLAPVLVDCVRRLRCARLLMRLGRERHRSAIETVRTAVDLLIEKDNEILRLRGHLEQMRGDNRRLREEMQRYIAAVASGASAEA